MLIDWFTVVAQAANFLILVWLMKRYLYRPVLAAIDAREARIVAGLKDAQATQAEAAQERSDFQKKNADFELRRATLLDTAIDEAQAERKKLLDEARQDAGALRMTLDAAVQREHDTVVREVTTYVRGEVFAVTRNILTDLAAASIEERMVDAFIERLPTLPDREKAGFVTALKTAPQTALLSSAFALPVQQRDKIRQAVAAMAGVETPIVFDVAPALVCGIELRANGRQLAWNVDDYLVSLGSRVSALLAAPGATATNKKVITAAVMATQPPVTAGQSR